jgi:hypothetical protein
MSRKQGLPERGRGAPCIYGDLTAKADMGGPQPQASVSGRIPIKIDVAPAPPRRPPRALAGMRPPAIATSRRQGNTYIPTTVAEAAA